jgi:hypothetical protein
MPGTRSRHAHPVDVRVPILVHIDTETLEDNDLLEVDAVEDVGEAAGRIERVALAAEINVADEERARKLFCRARKTREEMEDAVVQRVGRTPIQPLPVRERQSTWKRYERFIRTACTTSRKSTTRPDPLTNVTTCARRSAPQMCENASLAAADTASAAPSRSSSKQVGQARTSVAERGVGKLRVKAQENSHPAFQARISVRHESRGVARPRRVGCQGTTGVV